MAQPHERLYDLDWLRTLAFVILMFFHTGMLFVGWPFHLMSEEPLPALKPLMTFSHHWRLALLFLISGAGTWFSLRRRGPASFAGERLVRLLIPTVFGMIAIIPPQVYVERLDQGAVFESYWAFLGTVFEMEPYPAGNLSWHHLWFVVYLLAFSLLLTPLLTYLRSPRGRVWRDRAVAWLSASIWRLYAPALLLAGVNLALRWRWPDVTHALYNDWATFGHYLTLFLLGFLVVADPNIRQLVLAKRRSTLVLALGLYPAYRGLWPLVRGEGWLSYAFYYTLSPAFTWLFILAILGYARRYLSKPSPFLRYANEAVYPFYILHQSAMLAVAYFVLPLPLNPWLQFLAILLAMFAACALLYEGLIRRFNLTRLLFGLKLKSRAANPTRRQAPETGEAPGRAAGNV